MLHQVILAGGSGTRFWPLSRRHRPKQLLGLDGGPPLVVRAAALLESVVPSERRWVVTTAEQREPVRALLDSVPEENVIAEPCGRDTAAAIGLGAATVARRDPEATIVFMPADHVIEPPSRFRATIEAALRLLARRPEAVVTIGIPPRGPSTAFGYIERGEPLRGRELGSHRGFTVLRFREKPDRETAERYIATGRFYWNAGIFCWRAQALLAQLEQRLPETARAVRLEDEQERAALWPSLERISVDYALLEHHPEVLVVEADFNWSDLGSWNALPELLGADDSGCTVSGAPHVGLDSANVIAVSDDGAPIATIGVRDLVVVRTADATLVCARDRVQDVKRLVQELGRRGLESLL